MLITNEMTRSFYMHIISNNFFIGYAWKLLCFITNLLKTIPNDLEREKRKVYKNEIVEKTESGKEMLMT